MGYVLDCIVVAIVIATTIIGYRRGFLRSILQAFGCIIAFSLAFWLSNITANFLFDTAFHDTLHGKIVEGWEASVSDGVTPALADRVEKTFDALPSILKADLDAEAVAQGIRSSVGTEQTGTAVADYIVNDVVGPLIVAVIRCVAFLILFVVLLFAIRLCKKLLKPITKLPLVRQADKWLGFVFGLIQGIILMFVAVTLMQVFASVFTNGLVTRDDFESSFIVGWLVENNPLSAVIK